MPRFPLYLALLLLTLLPTTGWSAAATGEELFKTLGCRGCHQLAKQGGSLGPTLDGLGKRHKSKTLRPLLLHRRKGSAMPSYDQLTETELATLIAYLESL
ncbi:MAG: cytochrome c [Desulfuromonadaceae bacterium]